VHPSFRALLPARMLSKRVNSLGVEQHLGRHEGPGTKKGRLRIRPLGWTADSWARLAYYTVSIYRKAVAGLCGGAGFWQVTLKGCTLLGRIRADA
jgi:hypothetical protein